VLSDIEVERAFEEAIIFSGPIPAQAVVSKGHDIFACVQQLVSECQSLILNVFLRDECRVGLELVSCIGKDLTVSCLAWHGEVNCIVRE
jgi:hypothetical protein